MILEYFWKLNIFLLNTFLSVFKLKFELILKCTFEVLFIQKSKGFKHGLLEFSKLILSHNKDNARAQKQSTTHMNFVKKL